MNLLANILVLLLGTTSIGLWIETVRRIATGLPVVPHRNREPIRWNPLVLILTFTWIAFQVFAPFLIPDSKSKAGGLESIQFAGMITLATWGILLLLLSEAGRRDLSEFGLSLNGWRQESQYGLLGFIASLLPVYFVILVTLALGLRTEETQHTLLKMLRGEQSLEILLWIGLVAVVLAPLSEELMFRVILQGWLQSKFPPAASIGVSSVIFAGVHGFPDSVALIPLAVILGYVYYRRHSYLAVVLLHALFNLWNVLMSQTTSPEQTPDTALMSPGS